MYDHISKIDIGYNHEDDRKDYIFIVFNVKTEKEITIRLAASELEGLQSDLRHINRKLSERWVNS
jgi:hypothetical protein